MTFFAKTTRTAVIAAGLMISAAVSMPAKAADFAFDKAHTSVYFIVNHLGYSNMIGRFSKVDGAVSYDEAKPAESKLSVTIQTESIDTNLEARDNHLRSPDFFNVLEFPEMTFVSTKVEPTGEKTAKVTGDLTLLGVTKPVTLDVTVNQVAPHPMPQMNGMIVAGFSARGTVKRSDFGMKYGVPAIGDDVELLLEVEAQPKQ